MMLRKTLVALALGALIATTGITVVGCGASDEATELCGFYKRCTGYPGAKGCKKPMKECLVAADEENGFSEECVAKAAEVAKTGGAKASDFCIDLCAVCD